MNIVSCFPSRPGDRNNKTAKPSAKSIAACNGNVWAQLRLASPSWVVLVGGVALEALAPWVVWGIKPKRITEMHGSCWTWEDMHWMPIVHPAAALREQKYRVLFEKDISTLVSMLRSGPEYGEECFICGSQVYEYDVTGTPFCKAHQRNIEFGEKRGHIESQANQ